MGRGLRAPLSPNEENALCRIAVGLMDQDQIHTAHLARLVALMLIEARDGKWGLTALGTARTSGGRQDST